ncbi:alpha/beta hydrolase family protein [Pedococcus sp. 5OH_020]|uniref:alpha/beta hydrolase family protein n=1 Tax=Pedococcus sp. 5OH_020 TaxID=2989814 RepID=UPI0022EA0D77|nr:alpha/beta family hydrolase [Pedococcus sp. 5OH_020]
MEIATPHGPGRATVYRPRGAHATLVLGHGAGGQGWAGDLVAVTEAMTRAGWAVALVDQPWRLKGLKVASRPPTLDEAWIPIVRRLRTGRGGLPGPLVVGGRSAGARVACRTADELAAAAVLCLAFPLHPPGRPAVSRADELLRPVEARIPLHVVQGERDPFGSPAQVREHLPNPAMVSAVQGAHSFGPGPLDVVRAASSFLLSLT